MSNEASKKGGVGVGVGVRVPAAGKEDWKAKTKRERRAAAERRCRIAGVLMDGFLRPLIFRSIGGMFAAYYFTWPVSSFSIYQFYSIKISKLLNRI